MYGVGWRSFSSAPFQRCLGKALLRPVCCEQIAVGLPTARPASFSSQISTNGSELAAARAWVDRLTIDAIPRDACEISYARSSGPGGQNVNK